MSAAAATAAAPSGLDTITMLLQALQQRQIPPLPGPAAQPYAAPPIAAPAVAQPDGLALLRTILGNPHFQQAIQASRGLGAVAQRTVELPLPIPAVPQRARSVGIPLGAVMNAIAVLAGQSMTELNESTAEDEPEVPSYLVSDDGDFLVDPASADDRAALVAYLFRINDEAERSGQFSTINSRLPEADAELDECDEWARDAGFFK